MRNILISVNGFLMKLKEKKQREFERKIDFLRQQTYLYYLEKILKDSYEVDLPKFLYYSGKTLNLTAVHLTNLAMNAVIKQGASHINRCYRLCIAGLKNKR